jgi:hypothetical protein
MWFGKKDKNKSNERVLDLKARVDALRAADQASRTQPRSLDHFLEGDDVLTGREVEDEYKPTGFDAASPSPAQPSQFEANLQAELEKYIQRQEESERVEESDQSAQPLARTQPEAGSFSLEGTWNHDDKPQQPSAGAAAPDESWPADMAAWQSGFEPIVPEPIDESQAPWPSGSDWPAEEEWPPREEAV